MKAFLLYTALLTLFFSIESQAQTSTGKASFYHDKLHGNVTASGEKYDKFAHTAAHLTLPFGTKVKVTNLWNGKSVIVKINDRGPFAKERIIDLSKQAAMDIEMIAAGVVDVKVEVLKAETVAKAKTPTATTPKPRGDGTYKIQINKEEGLQGFGVQIGAFSDFLALLKKIEELESQGFSDIYVNTAKVNGTRFFRIVLGNYPRREDAELFLLSVKSKGYNGYVVRHQE